LKPKENITKGQKKVGMQDTRIVKKQMDEMRVNKDDIQELVKQRTNQRLKKITKSKNPLKLFLNIRNIPYLS